MLNSQPIECVTCKKIFECKIENKNKGYCLNYECRVKELEEEGDNFGRNRVDKASQKSP